MEVEECFIMQKCCAENAFLEELCVMRNNFMP
jgi:hypothetical protein